LPGSSSFGRHCRVKLGNNAKGSPSSDPGALSAQHEQVAAALARQGIYGGLFPLSLRICASIARDATPRKMNAL
jgi:hypothetical protein